MVYACFAMRWLRYTTELWRANWKMILLMEKKRWKRGWNSSIRSMSALGYIIYRNIWYWFEFFLHRITWESSWKGLSLKFARLWHQRIVDNSNCFFCLRVSSHRHFALVTDSIDITSYTIYSLHFVLVEQSNILLLFVNWYKILQSGTNIKITENVRTLQREVFDISEQNHLIHSFWSSS